MHLAASLKGRNSYQCVQALVPRVPTIFAGGLWVLLRHFSMVSD